MCCSTCRLASIFIRRLNRILCSTSAAAGSIMRCQFTPTRSISWWSGCGVTSLDCLPTHVWCSWVDLTSMCLSNHMHGEANASILELWQETSGLRRQTASYMLNWRRSSSTQSSKVDRSCCCFQTSRQQCDRYSMNWQLTGFTAEPSGTRCYGRISCRLSAADTCDILRPAAEECCAVHLAWVQTIAFLVYATFKCWTENARQTRIVTTACR